MTDHIVDATEIAPSADLVERVAQLISKHVKADATGLAPAVISHYLFGFNDAARAVIALFDAREKAAAGLLGAAEKASDEWAELDTMGDSHPGLISAIAAAKAAGIGGAK